MGFPRGKGGRHGVRRIGQRQRRIDGVGAVVALGRRGDAQQPARRKERVGRQPRLRLEARRLRRHAVVRGRGRVEAEGVGHAVAQRRVGEVAAVGGPHGVAVVVRALRDGDEGARCEVEHLDGAVSQGVEERQRDLLGERMPRERGDLHVAGEVRQGRLAERAHVQQKHVRRAAIRAHEGETVALGRERGGGGAAAEGEAAAALAERAREEEVVDERAVVAAHGLAPRHERPERVPRDGPLHRPLGDHARQPPVDDELSHGPRQRHEPDDGHARRVGAGLDGIQILPAHAVACIERIGRVEPRGTRTVLRGDVLPPPLVERAVRLAGDSREGFVEVVYARQSQQRGRAVGQQPRQRRVAVLLGKKAHLRVADGIQQAPVPRRRAILIRQPPFERGRPQPALAALRVPLFGFVLRQPLCPEARRGVGENPGERAEVGLGGAVMEDVRQLVRQHPPEPLVGARPHIRHGILMHPDVGVAAAQRHRKTVDDLILVRQVDADFFVERDAEVFRECGVGRLGQRGGFVLNAREVGWVGNAEVRRLGYLPVEFRVVAPARRVEALRARIDARESAHGEADEQAEEQQGRQGRRREKPESAFSGYRTSAAELKHRRRRVARNRKKG